MSMHLKEFNARQIVLNDYETRKILAFFYPEQRANIATKEMTIELKSFAQAMLIEGVRVTQAQNALFKTLQEIFTAASGVSLAKTTADGLFKVMKAGYNTYSAIEEAKKEVTVDDLQKGKVADNIRKDLARNYRTPFENLLNYENVLNNEKPHEIQRDARKKINALVENQPDLQNPQIKSVQTTQTTQTSQTNENSMNGMTTMDYIQMVVAKIEAEKASQPSTENQAKQGRSV